MNVYLPNLRLPSEYQEVEYIQSSGTQFIDTGLYPGNNIQVETKVEVSEQLGTDVSSNIFGSYILTNPGTAPSGGRTLGGYYHLTALNSKWYYGTNGEEYNVSGYTNTVGTQYEIIYNDTSNRILVNGTSIATATGTVGYTGSTLTICRRGNYSQNFTIGKWKYYYFRMYNKTTGQYERDFVPCYRKSDSIIGLYDLVNSVFYTNAGSGTFSKGNDVTMAELKNAYIGEVVTQTYNLSAVNAGTGESIRFNDISKSGYKVISVSVEGSGQVNSVSTGLLYTAITKTSDFNDARGFALNIGSGNTSAYSGLRVRQNGSNLTPGGNCQFSSSHINYTTNNTFKFTFDKDYNYNVVINGHTYSGTYTDATVKSAIDSVLTSGTIKYRIWVAGTQISAETVKVTYAKI